MALFNTKQVHEMINQYYYGEETAESGADQSSMAWLQKEDEHMKAFDSN
jgi:hypothetical protein